MLKLLIDTSGKEIGVGVFDNDTCLFESYTTSDKRFNAIFTGLIDKALKKSKVKISDIDIFASTLGPGMFTGIRVGMAAMKSFAQSMDKKFYGTTTLEIMANSAGVKDGHVTAIIDARRGEVYSGRFKYPMSDVVSRKSVLKLIPYGALAKIPKSNTVIILKKDVELLKKGSKINFKVIDHIDMKSFNNLIRKNRAQIKKENIFNMAPVYVRKSDAEIYRKSRGK